MIPPVGYKYNLFEIFISFFKNKNNKIEFPYLQSDKYFLTNYGRAALFLGLIALKKYNKNRNEVILSSFNCDTVLLAIKKSGLKPVFCDINKEDLNLSIEDLKNKITEKTLCVINSPMFGIANDAQLINKIVKFHNAFLIEDLAQSYGTKFNDEYLGNFGDLTVLSFGKAKIISTYNGGALIVNNNNLLNEIENVYDSKFTKPELSLFTFSKFLFFQVLINPLYFRWVIRIKNNNNQNSPDDFVLKRLNFIQYKILFYMLSNIEKFNEFRKQNASRINNVLVKDFYVFGNKKSESIYFRIPILTKNENDSKKLVKSLRENGIWAGDYIFPSLDDTDNHKNLRQIIDRIVTLPNNNFISLKDYQKTLNFNNN